MSPTPPDPDACPHCRQTQRFPQGWQPVGQHASRDIGAWTRAGHFGLWRCESCGALWSARYDQYSADYECAPVPKGLEKLLHPLAKPGEMLRLLDTPSLTWLIEAYFRQASYDLTEAADSIVAAMAREPLADIQALRLLEGLSEVFRKAEALARADSRDDPLVRLGHARPLVRLIEREGLARDAGGESLTSARNAMRERTRAILTVLLARSRPAVSIDAASRHRLSRLSGIRSEPLSNARSKPDPVAEADRLAAALRPKLQQPGPDARIAGPAYPRVLEEPPRMTKAERESGLKAGAALVAGSAILASTGGFLLGEFLIPAGAFLLSVLLFAGLLLAFILLAFRCTACGRRTGVALGTVVMFGALLLGHYLAYAWDGEEWAARYYAQPSAQARTDVDGLTRRQLLHRMIAERLGEPAAGGPFDLLRLRAKLGSRMLVSARWGFLPDRGRRSEWQMWAAWTAQAVFALAAAVVVLRLIPRDGE